MITYCLAVFSCYREEKDGKRESCKLIDEKTELDVSVKVKKKNKYLDSLRGLFFLLCAIEENQLSSTVTASFFLFLRKFF